MLTTGQGEDYTTKCLWIMITSKTITDLKKKKNKQKEKN